MLAVKSSWILAHRAREWGVSSGAVPHGADAVLDLGGEFDHGGRAVEDADWGLGAVLGEPLAVGGQHGCVRELVS
ncbi:hypothetical protein [Streptomyces sp. NBC_01789]|uniref:hypothetical protein n=1 Tax=Streptomyces sp. NBC_01789 TaxID=2975941 RepID=UPI0022528C91|nr:hypothetical protein [Streptomyces sp. NBC_01789]MCX4447086.1 hypothetical protein [Streptomyces sp. NBC_01789]